MIFCYNFPRLAIRPVEFALLVSPVVAVVSLGLKPAQLQQRLVRILGQA